jgi:hypothetical protein
VRLLQLRLPVPHPAGRLLPLLQERDLGPRARKDAADTARDRFEFKNLRQEREKQEKAEKLAAKAAATREKVAAATPRRPPQALRSAAKPTGDDAKRALIEAAMEKARQQKAQAAPKNTEVAAPRSRPRSPPSTPAARRRRHRPRPRRLTPARPPMNNSPFVRKAASVQSVMLQVLLALVPGIAAYVWFFGAGILVQLALASAAALAGEAAMLAIRGKPKALFLTDLSAIVTAWLIALTFPPIVPWWLTVTGTLLAVVVVKQLYGGLGQNPFNPAMAPSA